MLYRESKLPKGRWAARDSLFSLYLAFPASEVVWEWTRTEVCMWISSLKINAFDSGIDVAEVVNAFLV
jgi:hypothetical protein